ncbi:MAG: hypothetical protein H0V76_07160 [Blastocatellia bacterium]|nr:hypothetical protein [Blastocatellia bacterium]
MIDLPGGAAVAGIAAFIFFIVLAGVAYIIFRMLRKTVRMAFRMAIVAAILVIAMAGSLSLWWLNSGASAPAQKAKPTPAKKK